MCSNSVLICISEPVVCTEGRQQCPESKACFTRCDGRQECSDGSDEDGCGKD